MQQSNNVLANYISLFVMTALTVVTIIAKETTVFYILYLFWFDEVIKTVFDGITLRFKKSELENPPQFLSYIRSRFFILAVYFIFILVFFGLMIDWDDQEIIIKNLFVLFFKNTYFNITLVTFIVREIYLYNSKIKSNEPKILFSSRILILHISIVLGGFFWFLSTQKFEIFKEYATVLSIVPFLILKILFEIKSENKLKYLLK